jgi:uncharacterized membrane protein
MSEFLITGVTITFACLLTYRIKSRQLRKWLGITLAITGGIATFIFTPTPDEFHLGMIFFILWMCGLLLFFERGRYEDDR